MNTIKKILLILLFAFGGSLHLLLAIMMIVNGDHLLALIPTICAGFSFTYCTIKLKNGFPEDEEDADI